jgi:hypothetical protein
VSSSYLHKKEKKKNWADRQKDNICLWFVRRAEHWYQQFFSLSVFFPNTSQGWTFVAEEKKKKGT